MYRWIDRRVILNTACTWSLSYFSTSNNSLWLTPIKANSNNVIEAWILDLQKIPYGFPYQPFIQWLLGAPGSPRTSTGIYTDTPCFTYRVSRVFFNVNLETGRRTIPIVYVYIYIFIYICNCNTYCLICICIYIYVCVCLCVYMLSIRAYSTQSYGGRLFFTGPPRMKSISFASHWVLPATAGLGTVACNVAPSTSCWWTMRWRTNCEIWGAAGLGALPRIGSNMT